MTEESCRTRSQKRALEREINQNDVDSKKMKLDKGLLGVPEANTEGGDLQLKTDSATGRGPGLLKGAEMKATIKVEVQTGDEPVDMSTSKRCCHDISLWNIWVVQPERNFLSKGRKLVCLHLF
uniref:Uncharacterized protein n=1 Tax=Sphaerodactylus townsendi TaxID=933632 RepID=A0ACB8F227_9SAUR